MARKPSDIGELARALKAPSFGSLDAGAIVGSVDPVSPTTLVLEVAQIKTYEHNPRTADNPEYPRLKDSIRTRRGLTTPLTVTKRPGEALYTIAAGGNSRLKALKELAEETGDEAFTRVTCRFAPWESECQVFANHLIENDVRGTMSFGDKARAILEWRGLYEGTHPGESELSHRALVERLAESGYRVHQSLLTRLLHAAEWLVPHLPIAFGSGLGRPAAEQLLRLRGCCQKFWDARIGQNSLGEVFFDEFFAGVLESEDCHSGDFEPERFQGALVARLATTLGLDSKLVALDLDSLYHGYEIEAAEVASRRREPDAPGLKSDWAFERMREADAQRKQRANARRRESGVRDSGARSLVEREAPPPDDGRVSGPGPAARAEVPRLREVAHAAARALAAHCELGALVREAPVGFGFFVEAPEPSAVPADAKDRPTGPGRGLALTGLRSSAWWVLCLTAEQLVPAHLTALGQSYPASWLVELFAELPQHRPEQDPRAMLQLLVGEPSLECATGDLLTSSALGEEGAEALDRLWRACRALRAVAEAGAFPLWDPPS